MEEKQMKKKIAILVIGVVIAGIFYLNYVNEENTKVNKEWALTDEQVSNVVLKGISQDLNVILKKGDTNTVQVAGEMPVSFADKLKEIQPEKDKMLISFATEIGVSIAKNSKEKLTVTIQTTDTKLLKELNIKMNKGNVVVQVPNEFERRYELETNKGEVTNPKSVKNNADELIKVELGFGNIDIVE